MYIYFLCTFIICIGYKRNELNVYCESSIRKRSFKKCTTTLHGHPDPSDACGFHSAFTGSMFIGQVCVAECTALVYYYIVLSGHFVI